MTEKNKDEIKTSALLRKISATPDIEKFMECNAHEMDIPPFHVYITNICRETHQIPEQVIKQANIERTYGHQLFNGTRKPSRDKVIQLAFGFCFNFDDTQKLLQIAQKSLLYPKIKRDAAIIYCINNRKDVFEVQSILQSLGLTLLGGE